MQFFIACQVEGYRNVLKPSFRPLLSHVKHFKKTKRGLELVSLPRFLHEFLKKIFLLLYSFNCP